METPFYKIAFKDESRWMLFLSRLLFWNKDFMTDYTTTVGSTVWFPSRRWVDLHPVTAKIILCHEMVHIMDQKRFSKFLFGFLYTLPQSLILLAIPMFILWGWLGLLPLIAVAPIPAYFRMKFELRAYTVSIYALYRLDRINGYNIKMDQQIQYFTDQFTSSYYYFMWPFSKPIKASLNASLADFRSGKTDMLDRDYYDVVDRLLKNNTKIV